MALMRVYVAAPFGARRRVREIHERLRSLGHEPTSAWADTPDDAPGSLRAYPVRDLRRMLLENYRGLYRAQRMIVLADEPNGRETYCEAGTYRHVAAVPVSQGRLIWVGEDPPLSAYDISGLRVASDDEALRRLTE